MSEDLAKKHSHLVRVGRKYSPEEVLQHFRDEYVYARPRIRFGFGFEGHLVKMGSHRYWTFAHKGLRCVSCGIKGEYFYKEKCKSLVGNKYHFNLYATDSDGDEVLLTKDHIKPRSQGGRNHISNYQTMCMPCNTAKGDDRHE